MDELPIYKNFRIPKKEDKFGDPPPQKKNKKNEAGLTKAEFGEKPARGC